MNNDAVKPCAANIILRLEALQLLTAFVQREADGVELHHT
jgi:hypothetical protein